MSVIYFEEVVNKKELVGTYTTGKWNYHFLQRQFKKSQARVENPLTFQTFSRKPDTTSTKLGHTSKTGSGSSSWVLRFIFKPPLLMPRSKKSIWTETRMKSDLAKLRQFCHSKLVILVLQRSNFLNFQRCQKLNSKLFEYLHIAGKEGQFDVVN